MPNRFRLCLALLLFGATLPAAAQEQLSGDSSLCRSMGPTPVLVISIGILMTVALTLTMLYWRLQHGGWSLANAVSEPTHLTIPLDENWAQSQGDNKSRIKELGITGKPTSVTLMEASSSRLIALAGMVAILLIYVGFGVFSLYTYGLTCQMPASTVAVSTFLYSGLTLFAPYVANKMSGLLQSSRQGASAPQGSPETAPITASFERPLPAAAVLSEAPATATTTLRPIVTPPVRTGAGNTPARRLAGPAASTTPQKDAGPEYQHALTLIAEFEGFVDHAYPDPASGGEPWTIGYGFTSLDGRPVQPGDTLSRAEADAQLLSGVNACARHLAALIPYWSAMALDQRCALISFAWNLGEDFYGSSGFDTISRCLQQRDWNGVPNALLLYCDPGTAVSAGLLRRRQAEAALWQQGLASQAAPAATSQTATAVHASQFPTADKEKSIHPNPLNVPWFDQLSMDDGQGWRDCFSASSAMLAAFWGREPNEDDYNALRQKYGDSTSAEAQLGALRHLGLQAEFRTDGSLDSLKAEIDAGRPVAVGWLHHGPPSAPSGGGHWTVVIGYDETGVIMNDPYGSCDLVNGGYPENHNGAHQHYSYANWEPRWRPEGSGGWYLVAQR
ncbi:MAG: glycoside hydrolase family protein [bacterium]|jgi:GH24 family phage-related lysozyme (muramidase)